MRNPQGITSCKCNPGDLVAYWSIGDSRVGDLYFSGNTNLRYFGNVFKNDIGRTSLRNLFSGCTSLTAVDLSPLAVMVNVTTLYETFKGCTNLVYFTNFPYFAKLETVNSFMYECISFTGRLPEFWIQYYGKNISNKSNCFSSCKKAENWLEVPVSWGGTAPEYVPPVQASGVMMADYRALEMRIRNIEIQQNMDKN